MSRSRPAAPSGVRWAETGWHIGAWLGHLAWLVGVAGIALCLSVIGLGAGVVALGAALVLGFLALIARYGGQSVALLVSVRAENGVASCSDQAVVLPHRP